MHTENSVFRKLYFYTEVIKIREHHHPHTIKFKKLATSDEQ